MKYVSYLNFTFLSESMRKFEQTMRELVNISSYATYDMGSIMKIKHRNLISPLMVPLSCVGITWLFRVIVMKNRFVPVIGHGTTSNDSP